MHFYVPDVIVPPAIKKTILIPKHLRTCRFCKKSYPEVSFKKDAHILPQFLGNKYLTHDIECDDCNSKFSRYETSFADSIGLFRTIDGIRGHRGIPKFKNEGFIAFSKKDESGQDVFFIQTSHPNKALFNNDNKTITFETIKTPYIPLHVMKSLFKIGYSLLNENEVNDYWHLEKIINTTELDTKLKDYCRVLKFTFPYYQRSPIVITFRKSDAFKKTNIPSKIILLYFGRFMYEYILLNSTDEFMIKKGGEGKAIYVPPYWDENYEPPTRMLLDYSSSEARTESEEFLFTIETDKSI